MTRLQIKAKRQKAIWKSPLFVVCATAMIVLGLRIISYLRSDAIDPQVVVEASNNLNSSKDTGANAAAPIVFDSADLKIADRRREAAALVLAAGLYITNETLQGRSPQNAQSIIEALARQNLLPPSIVAQTTSTPLSSAHAAIYLRYRPSTATKPFGIEVISIGRDRFDGPAMLIRISGETADQPVSLYQASQPEDKTIPQPFFPDSDLIASGWLRQSFVKK